MEAEVLLKDIFFVFLYGGVMMLNLVGALYLLFRRGNAIAPEVTSPVLLRRWAAVLMIAFLLSHLFWFFYANNPSPLNYALVCGMDILMFIPAIVGFQLSMLQDRHRPIWPILTLMLPALVLFVLSIVRDDYSLQIPATLYAIFWYALFAVVMFFGVRSYGRWIRDNYADLENKEIWQSTLVIATFLLFFVIYCISSEKSIWLAYVFQIISIVIVVLVIWRVETLPQLSDASLMEAVKPVEETQRTSAHASAIQATIGPLLEKNCENGQLYLQHDLSLTQLAHAIGTNRYYLSQYFAGQGLTYNTYINNLRIGHFINLYHKAVAEGQTFTAQQLAFESGYHSYSTFGAVFKQLTGKTVTAWMQEHPE